MLYVRLTSPAVCCRRSLRGSRCCPKRYREILSAKRSPRMKLVFSRALMAQVLCSRRMDRWALRFSRRPLRSLQVAARLIIRVPILLQVAAETPLVALLVLALLVVPAVREVLVVPCVVVLAPREVLVVPVPPEVLLVLPAALVVLIAPR